MPSKAEKERRSALLKATLKRENAKAESRMPITKPLLAALFDYLDNALETGCDHTLAHTRAFLKSHKIDETAVIPWLAEFGGYCDCEVLANVEESWS